MKRSLSFLVIALLCGLSVAMAYSWTTPSHPKTARAHALDASKMIKQWMLRAKDSLEVDNDRFPDLIKQAEILANEAGEPGTTTMNRIVGKSTDVRPSKAMCRKIYGNGAPTFSRSASRNI